MLPLAKRGNRLFVAVSDPANLQALEEVRFKTNLVVEPVVVEDDKLGSVIHKILEASGATLKDAANLEDLEVDMAETGGATTLEEDAEVEDAPVVKYIQKILLDAIAGGASDIHFEPYERFYRIRYRVDGILHEVAQPPLAIKDKVASRIKVVSRLDIAEKRVPQDGRMKLMPCRETSKARRFPRLDRCRGRPAKDRARMLDSRVGSSSTSRRSARGRKHQSLIAAHPAPGRDDRLVTGPTGPARRCSLYTCLNILSSADGIRKVLDGGGSGRDPPPDVNQDNGNERRVTFATRPRLPRARTPTSSWSVRCATSRPPDIATRPRRPATSCCRPAHQRRADDADALAQHGRRAVQRRVVGDPDHRAAPRPQAVHALQASRGATPSRRCCAPASARRTARRTGSKKSNKRLAWKLSPSGWAGGVRIFAGTEPAHLFCSDDLGHNWAELPALRSGDTSQWNFPGPPHIAHTKHIAFHPHDPDTLFVSVEQGGLLKSADSGRTFEVVRGMDATCTAR